MKAKFFMTPEETIEEMKGNSQHLLHQLKQAKAEVDRLTAENEKLKALLRHADRSIVWEHHGVPSGFQEQVEAALGIGVGEQ